MVQQKWGVEMERKMEVHSGNDPFPLPALKEIVGLWLWQELRPTGEDP